MKVVDLLKYLKDFGLIGALAGALWWMNGRLTDVEQRMYDCFEEREKIQTFTPRPVQSSVSGLDILGVLTEETKVRNDKRRN